MAGASKPRTGRPPGTPKTGGRKPGVPNKVTTEFRQTVQKLLDDNRGNVSRWLTLVAEGDPQRKLAPDPGKALDLMAKLAEFAAPKLSRTEVSGSIGIKTHEQWLDELR